MPHPLLCRPVRLPFASNEISHNGPKFRSKFRRRGKANSGADPHQKIKYFFAGSATQPNFNHFPPNRQKQLQPSLRERQWIRHWHLAMCPQIKDRRKQQRGTIGQKYRRREQKERQRIPRMATPRQRPQHHPFRLLSLPTRMRNRIRDICE